MRLSEAFENINQSNTTSWSKLTELEGEYHTKLIYKDNINLEIHYGKVLNDNYIESWATQSFNSKARQISLEILYNGRVIYKDYIIEIDRGRISVLMPEIPNVYSITQDGLDRKHLAEIIDEFESYGVINLEYIIEKFKEWKNAIRN